MNLTDFQDLIHRTYFTRDRARGSDGTFLWFAEEVGELARALRQGSQTDKEEEFADVLAWLVSLASLHNVDMTVAVEKYTAGCPYCGNIPCSCPPKP